MICEDFKFIYIHVPKCAGLSLEKIFNAYQGDHRSALDLINHLGHSRWHEFFKFTIVRNTWDRAVSMYFSLLIRNKINNNLSFSNWLHYELEQADKNKRYFFSQLDYIFIDGKNSMNQIIRFERIKIELPMLFEKLNIKKNMIHENKSSHKHYSKYYNKEDEKFVYKYFEEEIDYFKYKFNSIKL